MAFLLSAILVFFLEYEYKAQSPRREGAGERVADHHGRATAGRGGRSRARSPGGGALVRKTAVNPAAPRGAHHIVGDQTAVYRCALA